MDAYRGASKALHRVPPRAIVACTVASVVILALVGVRRSLLVPDVGSVAEVIPANDVPNLVTAEEHPVALNYHYATDSFRENLRAGSFYITAFTIAGLTNQFLDYSHLLYLAFLTERIPIVPPFVPSEHIAWETPPMRFSRVFNITSVQRMLGRPVLDWEDVKKIEPVTPSLKTYSYSSNVTEPIGCWSTRVRNQPEPANPTNLLNLFGFDASFTRVPDFAFMNRDQQDSPAVTFHALAATIAPKEPYDTRDLPLFVASPSGSKLAPDTHLACYDFLYYATSGIEEFEWRYTWSPEWRLVAKNLPFTQEFVDLATVYLRKIFAKEIAESGSDDLPPMITMHIRRGDFSRQCFSDKPCRTGTAKFAEAIQDVKKRLAQERGLIVTSVFVTSDELDPGFWDEVKGLGWKFIDHEAERTVERYNDWYPPIIDTVALSFGVGFVGTLDSTFSTVSAKRVEDWNNGFTKMVHRHL